MPIKLYYTPASPPCRAVLQTAKILGIEFELKTIDMMKGEHKTPAFKKINPQHTIPFMDDNGFTLSESRAIMEYLVDAYGKSDQLFPKDAKTRALISARLYFDGTKLYSSFLKAFLAPLFTRKPASDEDFTAVRDSLAILDTLLGNKNFLVGSEMTIADVAIASTISNFELIDYDLGGFRNVLRFYENAKKTMPDFVEINIKGGEILGNFYKSSQKKQ